MYEESKANTAHWLFGCGSYVGPENSWNSSGDLPGFSNIKVQFGEIFESRNKNPAPSSQLADKKYFGNEFLYRRAGTNCAIYKQFISCGKSYQTSNQSHFDVRLR